MNRLTKILLGILITILSLQLFNLLIVVAQNSCTSLSCIVEDTITFTELGPFINIGIIETYIDKFTFGEYINYLVGKGTPTLLDSFHFLDASISVSISNSIIPPNPFTTTTLTNTTGIGTTLLDNIQDKILTTIVAPTVYMLGVFFFASKIGIKEFPILIGLATFSILALVWAQLLPSYVVIIPILYASAILSMVVMKWFGTHNTGN